MPIHDWTRVTDGTFHDFHVAWLAEIRTALNDGLLPADYYAQAEQVAGPMGPDVLTLQSEDDSESIDGEADSSDGGGVAVAMAPPKARWTAEAEMNAYISKRRTIVIRHSSGDRIVALIEILSPGNKSSKNAIRKFVEKATEALHRGYHLLVVDLFPPTRRDPNGIHGCIWDLVGDDSFELPTDEPLTLAAYSAGPTKRCFVEALSVGEKLKSMPLFLTPDFYVYVPLEATYIAAYRGVARKWKAVLEAAE